MAHSAHPGWKWIEPGGMHCGDGSPTGFALSVGSGSQVVAYLEGGGACNSASSCLGEHPTALHINGYDESNFTTWANSELARSNLFARDDAHNPFRDATIIYVPYCTGDLHAGSGVAPYGVHHVGYQNLTAVIRSLQKKILGRDGLDLVLTGASAGGCGALYNLYRVQETFPAAHITMIDDSCPLLPLPYVVAVANGAADPWNIAATLPAGCSGCAANLNNLYAFYASATPHIRMSHIEGLQDSVIAGYYAVSGSSLKSGLLELADAVTQANPNFKFYLTDSSQHQYLTGNGVPSLGGTSVDGTSLTQFLTEQLSGDPNWRTVLPASAQ